MSEPFEYRVVKDYEHPHFDFVLYEGDILVDADFPEPDIPAMLYGRGILEYVDQEREAARLADPVEAVEDDEQ